MSEQSLSPVEVSQPKFETLNDYVGWVTRDWVHEQGSDDAQLHVRTKLNEEVDELNEALEKGSPEDIKTELGDVLWTANAVALNEGFTLPTEPISLEGIDEQAKSADMEWDVPTLKALHNLTAEDIKSRLASGDLKTTQMVLSSLAGQLGKSGRISRVMALKSEGSPDQEHSFGDAWLQVQHGRVVSTVGQINLLVSLIAQSRLKAGISDIMQANYDKISKRLAEGRPVTS